MHLETRFVEVEQRDRRIRALLVESPTGQQRVEARIFIDATADIYLARAAGCRAALGPENSAAHGEPSASAAGGLVLNNASLCYRIAPLAPGEQPQIEAPPTAVDLEQIHPVTSIRTYANGDRNMNPVNLMTGREAYALGIDAYDEALKRLRAHWHLLQTRYGFDGWKRTWISPFLGVRETHRLVGRYVLKEQDLTAGLAHQEHEDIVALADHSIDFHGARPSREVPNGPYGIPFRCLLPRELDNLLVACRGASFSSIGASSCRLSRTLMVLGQAAGTAEPSAAANCPLSTPPPCAAPCKALGSPWICRVAISMRWQISPPCPTETSRPASPMRPTHEHRYPKRNLAQRNLAQSQTPEPDGLLLEFVEELAAATTG